MRLREDVRFSAVVWMFAIAEVKRFWYAPRAARELLIDCRAASTEASVAFAFVVFSTSMFEIAVPDRATVFVAAVRPEFVTVPPIVNAPPWTPE